MKEESKENTCDFCAGTGLDGIPYVGEFKCPECNPAIEDCSTVQFPHNTLEDFEMWIEDGCPEGVSGMVDDATWLLSTVKKNLTVGTCKQSLQVGACDDCDNAIYDGQHCKECGGSMIEIDA